MCCLVNFLRDGKMEVYMKPLGFTVFFVVLLATMLSCGSEPTTQSVEPAIQPVTPARQPAVPANQAGIDPLVIDALDITARGGIGWVETVLPGPMYTEDGGSNITLAVLAPDVQGNVPDFLPLYIQGMLNNNINRFSAISLIDRQNLNRIIGEQDLAQGGRFSDEDFVRIGHIANARYLLLGTVQRLSGDRFSLQLSITESSTGVRRATFMQDGTLAQLEGRGTLLNEATAELLGQIGVQLTETGRRTLLAGNVSAVQAEAGLARGIVAQAGGAEVAAMFNFVQAATFDPLQAEVLLRLNTLSATISGGTISERIVNDIQLRDQWLEAFKETARFFDNHPPFGIIFDPNLIQIGETDFARRTANLGMRIAISPSDAGFDALNTLLEGLEKTGRRSAWGFSGWPLRTTSPAVPSAVVFGGRPNLNYRVDVALLNESNQIVGRNTITLNTGRFTFASGDTSVAPPRGDEVVMRFSNVRADDLTPTLTIAIVAVNGVPSRELSATGYMRIETGDLEVRMREREAADRLALEQQERERQQQQQQRQQDLQRQERERREQQRRQDLQRQANVAYDRGWQNFGIRDFNRAIAYFTEAIQLNPNLAAAYFQRGRANYALGRYDRALADFTEVIRLYPNDDGAFQNRGLAHQRRARVYSNRGLTWQSTTASNQAITDFTEAIRLNPSSAGAFGSRGQEHRINGRHDQAILDLTDSLRLRPNSTWTLNQRGLAHEGRGERLRAIADFEAVISLDPNNTFARDRLLQLRDW